jgi:hypothetical protein
MVVSWVEKTLVAHRRAGRRPDAGRRCQRNSFNRIPLTLKASCVRPAKGYLLLLTGCLLLLRGGDHSLPVEHRRDRGNLNDSAEFSLDLRTASAYPVEGKELLRHPLNYPCSSAMHTTGLLCARCRSVQTRKDRVEIMEAGEDREPATFALFGLGLAGIGAMRRKNRAA